MPNERVRIHEHKALVSPCEKLLSVYVRDAFRISTWSLFSGLCFQARNSWHLLFFCWRLSNSVALLRAPPSGLGRNSCFRCKASCTKPRGPYHDGSVRIHVPRPVAIVDILTYRTIYGYERDHFWCRDILRLIIFL